MRTKPIGELAERFCLWVDRAFKGPNRHLIIITGVDEDGIRIGDQCVPVFWLHISADLSFRVDALNAKRYDLFLDAHLHPVKWHFLGMRVFDVKLGTAGKGTQIMD